MLLDSARLYLFEKSDLAQWWDSLVPIVEILVRMEGGNLEVCVCESLPAFCCNRKVSKATHFLPQFCVLWNTASHWLTLRLQSHWLSVKMRTTTYWLSESSLSASVSSLLRWKKRELLWWSNKMLCMIDLAPGLICCGGCSVSCRPGDTALPMDIWKSNH